MTLPSQVPKYLSEIEAPARYPKQLLTIHEIPYAVCTRYDLSSWAAPTSTYETIRATYF